MTIKLSVCIPTYNRAALIGKTLESIISQATDEVEIVVSDNASTDNTAEVVRAISEKFPRIKYVCAEENRGADANYMNAVTHATGEYCWLFGSDDVMREGAMRRVLEELKEGPTVLLTNRMECDLFLRPLRERKWLFTLEKKSTFDFSSDESTAQYFKSVDTLGGVFSFLSSIVVKRSPWEAIPMDQQFMGSAYSHVYKIFSMLLDGGWLSYLNDWTVYCRLDNDTTFSKDGFLRRVMLDLDGYYTLASVLLKEKPKAKEALFEILQRQQNNLPAMIRLVAAASLAGSWVEIKKRILRVGLDRDLIYRAEVIGTSLWYRPWYILIEFLRTWKYLTRIKVAVRYLISSKIKMLDRPMGTKARV